MRIRDCLSGIAQVEIKTAFPETVLNACVQYGVPLWNVCRPDACTLRFSVHEKELDELEGLVSREQAEWRILRREGGSQNRKRLKRRTGFLAFLLATAVLLILSHFYIWEIEVRGCQSLTSGEVLRALEDCGVTEGTFWPGLSSDLIRSQMLLRLPKLGWMTVRVSGSRAVVNVVERVEKPEIYDEESAADVVAAQTGIVSELTVLNGHPLVSRGSAVVKGEILITGSLDSLSHPTRSVRARGRVEAETWYEWTAVEPAADRKGGKNTVCSRFALKLGKKRLNLFAGSRKELDGYDKIVHEYRMGIRGLFSLPISLIRESSVGCELLPAEEKEQSPGGARLREMLSERVDGEILQARISVSRDRGYLYTTLRAHCLENIAQTAERTPP